MRTPIRGTSGADGSALTEATVQITTADGRVVGAGFLIEEQLLVTCAHVAEACGAGPETRLGWSSPPCRARRDAEPDGEHVLLVIDQFEELLAALEAHP